MKIINFLTIFFIIAIPVSSFAGTAYYVDCSSNTNGDGSYYNPWNTIEAVNQHSFQSGDDVYFKNNTTCKINSDNDRLKIEWSGTSNDRVIIGSYDEKDDFECGAVPHESGNRAIISGDNNSYPETNYSYPVRVYKQSYVTFQGIQFENIGKAGVSTTALFVESSDYIDVDNCYFYQSRGGLVYIKVENGTISNSTFEQIGYPDWNGVGAALELTSAYVDGATHDITVTKNKVFDSKHEGIGLYKNVNGCIIEKNVVYNIRSYHIYNGASKNNIFRYNIVYEESNSRWSDPSSPQYKGSRSSFAFASGIEETRSSERYNGYNEWYGNIVAGMRRGMSLSCVVESVNDYNDIVCHPNEKIYNNIFIDNDINIHLGTRTVGDSYEIKNNISIITNENLSSCKHTDRASATGADWDNNIFYGGAISGNAAKSAITDNPKLTKMSGWRKIVGELTGNEFIPNIDSIAFTMGKYFEDHKKDRLHSVDFKSNPFSVSTTIATNEVIGAFFNNSTVELKRVENVEISPLN
ncbi:uncharacterized protein Dvar_71540 [Desulfosarcina variabilis str. Montpellier]|uniref:right-handed parallel beta-helix repeat-containing protein n=1 Tax=Desulfosarcina variabilis TaxID=2300 RepID=UPI003AFA85BD